MLGKESDKSDFSESLSAILASSDFSGKRNELAERVGVSASAISQYLSGGSLPRVDVLAKLARELNVSTDQLIFGSERHVPLSREQAFFQGRLDDFLSRREQNQARRAWLGAKFAERIEALIDSQIDNVLQEQTADGVSLVPGMLSDAEVMKIEEVADSVVVASTTLKYNVTKTSSGRFKAGPFAETVVRNLQRGKGYSYVVPKESEIREASRAMVEIFSDLAGVDVSERVSVFETDAHFVAGFLIYRVSAEVLQETHPYVYGKVRSYVHDSYIGLATNTSDELAGDMLMDKLHLERALNVLDAARFGSLPQS